MRESDTLRLKSPQLYQLSYRPKHSESCTIPESAGLQKPPTVPAVCPVPNREDGSTIPFPVGSVVEITAGMSKGLRGTVIGPARSMFRGVPDVALRMEFGREAWIRPDYLKVVS